MIDISEVPIVPEHLLKEELQYEILIRGLQPAEKTADLRVQLRTAVAEAVPVDPNHLTELNTYANFQKCTARCISLDKAVGELEDTFSRTAATRIKMAVILLHAISTGAHGQCTVDSLASVHVNCSSQDLQTVPDGLPNTTESLNLDYNNISLMGNEFEGLNQMNELSLVGNGIRDFPLTVFSGLGQLLKLRLSNNNLNNLHNSVFSELFNLQEIYLDHNTLKCIHDELFANLFSVKIIDISHNYLQALNGSILFQSLTVSLLTLNASHNRLIFLSMPPQMQNLNKIDVSHNAIQYFYRLFSFNLEVVDFSNNNISKALLAYSSPILRVINLSHNILSSVIFVLTPDYDHFAVEDLIISEAGMTKVNVVIFSVTRHKLDLTGNNIISIDRHPGHSQLHLIVQNVSLARNPSIYIPDDIIKRFEKMTQFDMSGTTIDLNNFTLISEIFKLPKLTVFRIVGCQICELLPPNVLARYFNCSEKVAVVCADAVGVTGHTLPSIRSEVEISKTSSQNNTNVCPDQIAVPQQLSCPDLCFCITDRSETILDCTDVNIDMVMPFYTNYTVIKLPYNYIRYLSATSFFSQVNLLSLNISHNSIQTIPVDAFQNLTFLKSLDLSYNPLTYLPENVFKYLISLEELSLEENNLTVISGNIFNYLLNIRNLYLEFGIQLEKIPAGSFKNLTKMQFLKITHCGVKTIQPGVFHNLTNLMSLHLYNNTLRMIENGAFNYLPRLKFLHLSNNRIEMVGNETFKDTSINELDLNNNRLKQINLNSLVNLRICDLSHNLLKTIIFGSTQNIEILFLNNNNLSDLHSNIFKGFLHLSSLDLSNNPLKNIPSDLFHDVSNLMYLNLANTSLHSLPQNVFSHLIRLNYLILDQNNLHNLTVTHFSNLAYLYWFSFSIHRHDHSFDEETLNYRNITLIDYLHSKPYKSELKLAGHAICQQVEREQIIKKIFVSSHWRSDVCV